MMKFIDLVLICCKWSSLDINKHLERLYAIQVQVSAISWSSIALASL